MNWNSTADFFAMGGYALYVWGSFAIAAIMIGTELFLVRGRHRSALADLARELAARRAGSR